MKKLSLVNNNIVLIGPMGSGKTSIGRELSKLTNLKFIDIDDEIEKSTGVDIQTIFAHENEEGFRLREANALEKVSSINNSVISTGGGIVINEKNRKIIQSLGLVIYLQTNVENIFAIGDICGNPMLAHRATHQGKVAAEVACGHAAAFDVCAIPSVIYTDPEVAWAGLTEKEAIEKEIPFKKSEFPWAASGRAIAIGANQGKTKILFDPDTKQILGVAVVGPGAGDIISEGMLAMEMGSDAEDVSLTVHPHPTLGETFGMAAEVFEGTVTDLYIPKK